MRGDSTADFGTAADAGDVDRDGADKHAGRRRDEERSGRRRFEEGEGQEKVELVRRDD